MSKSEATFLMELLPKYSPFDAIDSALLQTLATDIQIKTAAKGFCLFEHGDYDSDEYFLVSGSVHLVARDGREKIFNMNDNNAHFPIARLRPRMYSAVAATPIHYFVIAASVLDELQRSSRGSESTLLMQETQQNAGSEGSSLLYEFKQELNSGRFVLPSLPEVALRIRELIEQPDFHMADLAKLVNSDPAIAAKLIKSANSAMYRGVNQCDDTLAAIARLGLITTKQMVTSFAVLALFKTNSSAFQQRMQTSWRRSMMASSYCYILAKQLPGFNEEEALLAGLLHNIGEVVLLAYAERFSDLSSDEEQLDQLLQSLSGQLGEMVLTQWGFAQELITTARESHNWQRGLESSGQQESPAFDYCDLVQVSLLFAANNEPDFSLEVPPMTQVPAFNKLENRQLSGEQLQHIIQQAQEQLGDLKQLLS